MNLAGQVALVTGATRGIGRAIAEKLAKCGARVIGTATSSAGATSISNYLNVCGEGVILDVTNGIEVKALLNDLHSRVGHIDILINNAGIVCDALLMRMKEKDWERVLAVNLTAIFSLAKGVVSVMVKRRYGRIINIGSVIGSIGNIGQANYAAAKAGIVGFSKALAREVASRGITVNVVAPGFIDTDMARSLSEDKHSMITQRIPIGRLGTTEEVAYAVAFLACKQAAYITGETLHINGGLHMA